MKFFVAFATLLLVGLAAAQTTSAPAQQNPGRVLLELLEKRSDGLVTSAKKALADFKATDEHLVKTLEEQVKKAEELDAELKKLVADRLNNRELHQVHVLEEQLFFLENRISEEVYAITHAKEQPPKEGETTEQLVARAEKLVKDAKDTVTKFPQAKEIGDINSELIVVEALIKTIQAKPEAAELKKVSEELARQEKSLQQLIEKAAARKP